MPKVAIVMATFNPNIDFFKEQVDSIINQTFKDWICFVQDDCSNQESYKFIQEYLSPNSRFVIERNSANLGSFLTFENGLKRLNNEFQYVAFSDQDDIWDKYKIEKIVKVLESDQKIFLVHSDLSVVDESNNLINNSCWNLEKRLINFYSPELLVIRNSITACSMAFRKELLDYALPFPVLNYPRSIHHDQWIALFAAKYGQIVPFKEPLIQYRQHSNNVVGAGLKYKQLFSRNQENHIKSTYLFVKKLYVGFQVRLSILRCFYERLKSKHKF